MSLSNNLSKNLKNNSPLKRALRNGGLLSVVVAFVVYFQETDPQLKLTSSLVSMLYCFIIITPALWLSYKWTAKLFNASNKTAQSDDDSTPT